MKLMDKLRKSFRNMMKPSDDIRITVLAPEEHLLFAQQDGIPFCSDLTPAGYRWLRQTALPEIEQYNAGVKFNISSAVVIKPIPYRDCKDGKCPVSVYIRAYFPD